MGTSELQGLLDQQPAVRDALLASVRLSDSAFGEVRFGSHFVHLGGMRAGPYTIRAMLKGSERELEVILCTTFRLLDRDGAELPEAQMEDAECIDDRLRYVVLREVTLPSLRPECP